MNKKERNIWKLNNLPPLEYCSISRAQKLLNCELEDLLHWHDIGAINLCLKLGKTHGTLKSAIRHDMGGNKPYFYNASNIDEVSRSERSWSQHSKINTILTLNESEPNLETQYGSPVTQFKLKVSVSGLWYSHSRNLMEILENPENTLSEQRISIISPARNVVFCHFTPDEDEKPTISLNKLYITNQAIEKIYEHTISSRPLEFSEKPLNIFEDKIIHDNSFIPQNKLLLEFINYIIRSNPAFSTNILNATENVKSKTFSMIMEKLSAEGMISNYIDTDSPTSGTLFK
ncbi:hypothetical protein HV213_08925 [Klebsiella sp. RHBSTW-00484]|uniref:hypothetical protein n=1 Tax=unclassified Klebsiella TaxID=2608929 RepID=UPI0015E55546|nr:MULTISPECIES: hypothetical protein [unclassified Klebsiella]MBA7848268.1 hypothetical protein [Klebsiella sp. RHBSTW-00465]QLO35937.1 hypothetical protein HV213_08925 [Klebsiella sp. RHBSTW-00484]QLT75453.1 hypothetical protein HV204_08925 [Klebsiella sp. RHBSTW-00464]